ncbi:hypothetical protein EVAR_42696_1 [Eumeta japonica]|uniref:Uncharacterized protein n=1 Tax=Eumeta variegata TaxID=151549 RepID=A0A4C1X030_EUMVA|nr:hypothetical protein EVAR_42696_1 [Eumeta japonica]
MHVDMKTGPRYARRGNADSKMNGAFTANAFGNASWASSAPSVRWGRSGRHNSEEQLLISLGHTRRYRVHPMEPFTSERDGSA